MTTLEQGYEAVATMLREFGYPDATADMVREVHAAMLEGKEWPDLPHGVIGGMAEGHIKNYSHIFEGEGR